MSGPTRQRSLRERLHGIGISWQGKKSKSYHSKDNQTFSEAEIKSGSLDSRSCDPIPSCDENIDKVPSSESDTPKDVKKESFSTDSDLPQAAAKVHEKTEEKCPEQKESSHTEKRSLCRTVTRPKGTQEYMVQASDTLAGIAARFDTTPSELAKLNRLPSRLIFPGQSLFVPEKKSVPGEGEDEHRDSTKLSSTQEYEDTPQGARGSLGDNVLSGDGLIGNGAPNLQRKASVTDPLRIPYRRHSERMQRFLKVKARHFTDGQGVVSGVLIITPNAVMFDPNVSDPLVIEHGTESYGVIAPLDMVMRTAIYFDIAHMKVKNVPETQINIPKADIYYGKQTPKSALPAEHEESLLSSATTGAQETPEKEHKESTDDDIKASDTDNKGTNKDGNASPENIISHKRKESDEEGINVSSPKAVERKDVDPLESTESPLRKESKQNELVSLIGKQLQGPKSTRSLDDNFSPKDENCREFSVINIDSKAMGVADSSLPQMDTEKPTESRRERMLKRLSYPMESITSYTQSSISRILSSSPKSLVDFSSGLFVRTSEEEKGKESNQVVETSKDKNREEEQVSDAFPEDTEECNGSQVFAEDDSKIEETSTQSEKQEKSCQESEFREHGDSSVIGYKNFVEDKPEVFAVLDKLLGQYNEQENEGPPLYLCLRMGHPKERKLMVSTPILSYGKKRAKPEYWFSIPHNRVEDLYTFIQQWIPNLYGDVDEVNPDELGFIPIDDTEEREEEQNEETKEESDKQNESAEDEEQRKSNPRSFLKLVEDHFGFRSISPTDWEVLSMNEADIVPSIELELPLPELLSPSEIFNETHVKQLYPLLPARACGYPWTMIFSTSANGFSLKTMYRRMALYDTPILLAVADTDGAVFGALLSSALKPSDYFYGTGESFLYTFHPEFKVFKWTGDNLYFIKGNVDSVAIGSGDGLFGLWLDADLYRGSSKKCLTFNNTPLSSSEDFTITALEAWGFV